MGKQCMRGLPLWGAKILLSAQSAFPDVRKIKKKDYRRATAAVLTCKGRSFLIVIEGVE